MIVFCQGKKRVQRRMRKRRCFDFICIGIEGRNAFLHTKSRRSNRHRHEMMMMGHRHQDHPDGDGSDDADGNDDGVL